MPAPSPVSRLGALRPRGAVWRSPDYVRLWSAASVSELGSQVTLLALPLAAISTLHVTAFELSALMTVDSVPLLLFALPTGVWIDRVRRRPIMLGADLARALALLSIPPAYAAGALTIWQLYAVGFVTGTLTICFDVAAQSFLATVAGRDELADANAGLQVSQQATRVLGPGLAGLLVGAVGAPYALLADAASYLGSAAFLARVRRVETPSPAAARRRMAKEIREGMRFVVRHPILRPNLAFTGVANVFNSIFFAVLLLFAVRRLGLSARQVGLFLTLAGLGSLAGAAFVARGQRRFGIGRVMVVSAFSGWGLLLVPLATRGDGIPLLALGLLIWGGAAVVYNTSSVTIVQATTPDRLLARVMASRRLVSWGLIPPATLLGGVLATYLGLRTTVLVGASGRALAGLILLASPIRSIRTLADADALLDGYDLVGADATVAPAAAEA